MVDVIAVVSGAIGLTKQLVELVKGTKDAEAKNAAAELSIQLAEIKTRVAELIEENNWLKDELKRATSTVTEVVVKEGVYYKPDGDGPFCTTCYDSQKKFIRLSEMNAVFAHLGRWRCGVCKNHFGKGQSRGCS